MKHFAAAVCILTAIGGTICQALTLIECFREAKLHNETVGTQRENLVQATEKRRQAIGAILPTVNGSYESFWQQNAIAPGGQAISQSYQPTAKITVTQPLWHGFQEYSGFFSTVASEKQQEHSLKYVAVQLFENVAVTFYSILSYEKDLQDLTTEIKYYDDRIEELNHFLKIGRSQLTDVLTVQTSRSALVAKVEQERGQLASARQTFAFQTGLPANTSLDEPMNNLPVATKDIDYYASRNDNRYDVMSNTEALKSAHANLWVAKEAHLPHLDFTYDRYLNRPAGYLNAVGWDAELMLTVPIFAGGITQSQVRQAESVREQANLSLSQTKRAGLEEIRATYELVQSDLRQIQELKETVKIGEEAFKEDKRQYRLGLVTNLDVLTALTNYIEALRSLDTGKYSLKSDLAHLKAAANFELEKELVP